MQVKTLVRQISKTNPDVKAFNISREGSNRLDDLIVVFDPCEFGVIAPQNIGRKTVSSYRITKSGMANIFYK